jgi:hypothetical protein
LSDFPGVRKAVHNARMEPGGTSSQSIPSTQVAAAARTLVVANDAHYHARAKTVLGELGDVTFASAAPTDPEDVTWLVCQERADVVVLDATGCEGAVARIIAALSTAAPRLGVVVVCEHLTDAARELDALPKWGWTRELRAAVQRAQVDGNPLLRRVSLSLTGRRDLRVGASAPFTRR